MIEVVAKLKSVGPMSQSHVIREEKGQNETHQAFEARTWRQRLNTDGDKPGVGKVFIPPGALKNGLVDVCAYLGEKIKGRGNRTYTKHFVSGLICPYPLELGIDAADIKGEEFFVPANGQRGGAKRVWKMFPVIPEWEAEARFVVVDQVLIDSLIDDKGKPIAGGVVDRYLRFAGQYIGFGRFRPQNNGYYGRCVVASFEVRQIESDEVAA